MGQILHGSATTIEAIRRAIQNSNMVRRTSELVSQPGVIANQKSDVSAPHKVMPTNNTSPIDVYAGLANARISFSTYSGKHGAPEIVP